MSGTHDGRSGRVAHTRLSRDGIGKVGSTGVPNPGPEVRLSSQDGGRVKSECIRNRGFPGDVSGHDGFSARGTEDRGGHVGLKEEVRERGGPEGGSVRGHVRRLSGISSSGELGDPSSSKTGDRVVDDQVVSGEEDGGEQVGSGLSKRVELDGGSGGHSPVGPSGRVGRPTLSLVGLGISGSGSFGGDLQDAVLLTRAVLGTDGRSERVDNVQVVVHLPDPRRVRRIGRSQLGTTSRVELTEVGPHGAILALGGRSTEGSQGGDDGRGRDVVGSHSGHGVKVVGNVVKRLDAGLESSVVVEGFEVLVTGGSETGGDHGGSLGRGSISSRGGGRGSSRGLQRTQGPSVRGRYECCRQ